MRELLAVALPRPRFTLQQALELVLYRQRRNYEAYRSHCKRRRRLPLRQRAPTSEGEGSL